jgi:L-seryl-tRNA(Ser) seleniumtransferase
MTAPTSRAAPPTPAALRELPSVDRLLRAPGADELVNGFGRELAADALRAALDAARAAIRAGEVAEAPADYDLVAAGHEWAAELLAPTLRPVINATGIIVHTNLGRAPLSEAALAAVAEAAAGYATLEYDVDEGQGC